MHDGRKSMDFKVSGRQRACKARYKSNTDGDATRKYVVDYCGLTVIHVVTFGFLVMNSNRAWCWS